MTAHEESGSVGEPGTAESLIPVWGSGRSAVNAFQTGHWGWGLFHSAMAIGDLFLVKSLATAGGKLLVAGGTRMMLENAGEQGVKRVAFGFENEARTLADEIGGTHLMDSPNWKADALEIFNNPNEYEVHFNLNGIDETPMNMINSPMRSSTNWEMFQLYQSPSFESATFYHGGDLYTGFNVFQVKP